MKISEKRLRDWLAGNLDDKDLSAKDIKKLEKAVFKAVSEVMLYREGVTTFAQHRTVQ